jgi:WD40 repeat protein
MKSRKTTTLMTATLLGVMSLVGGNGAAADEIYSMTKLGFCTPASGQGATSITISYAAFSQDGALVAIAADKRTVHVCETATGKEIASLAVPSLNRDDDDLGFVAFSRDGTRLLTASKDRMVRVFDSASGRALAVLDNPSPTNYAAFSPDGSRVVTWSGDTARLFDLAPGAHEPAVLDHPSRVTSIVFSPDGRRLVTACSDGGVHLWDVPGGREVIALQGHTDRVSQAAFSPDGARIVTASADGTARIWDAGGRGLLVLAHSSPVVSAAFSADGARIVTGSGSEAHVFDAASGRETAVLKGHETEVSDARFSADGKRIVTASGNTVRVFDAESGGQIAVLTGEVVRSAAFTPDGLRIFSAVGTYATIWSKLVPASLPDGVAGIWYSDYGRPDVPPEIVREACLRTPIKISGDGLVVFFEGSDSEPPEATYHLRCASDLSCRLFRGAPTQGAEEVGAANLTRSANVVSLCRGGQCRPLARCKEITWTAEERNSGFAQAWQQQVLGKGN